MFDNGIANQLTRDLDKHKNFAIEFFGYNITASNIGKKIYVKTPFLRRTCTDKDIFLDDCKLNLLSDVLGNKYLSSFSSDRYSLYDVSFREPVSSGEIGFCFNDISDSIYIEPEQIFKAFTDVEADFFCDVIKRIQKSMFERKPTYNPLFMLGLLVDDTDLICVKSYIRFDQDDVPSSTERGNMIEKIMKTLNPGIESTKYFFDIAQKLEQLGLVFSFIGVDCYKNKTKRYKLYFRFYGEKPLDIVSKEIVMLISKLGFSDSVQAMFSKHNSGLWGLAVSTNTFEYVNGIQLYFYP